ncbi:glycosyltransferase family 2 protein [Promicromonospora panici]|uniref:glycosyltransferase family 2 protein n=1 Tax=Promicromonospora panici TaxID=2219658 RepID=UPI0013EB039A|nr:glycosyltransferase family A protein [Promicromonospora panici]
MNRLFVLDLFDEPDLERPDVAELLDSMVQRGFEVLVTVPTPYDFAAVGERIRAVECHASWTAGRRLNHAVSLAAPAASITFAQGVLDGSVLDLVDSIEDAAATADTVVLESRVGTPAGPETIACHEHDPRRVFTVDSRSYYAVRGIDQRISRFGECLEDLAQRIQWTGARRVVRSVGDLDSLSEWVVPSKPQFAFPPDRSVVVNLPRWEYAPERPLVSVVIATRDRARFLPDAISSVLGQTMPDLEVIVVDDGSVDETREVLRSFRDPRVRAFHMEASGISSARNFATTQARGEWIAVHDDDDIMVPDRIGVQLRSLSREVDAVYGAWANFHDETGEMLVHLTRATFGAAVVLHNGQTPGHPTWLVRRTLLKQVPYDERLTSAVDHDVATRSLRLGATWRHSGHVATLRRIHDDQVSATDGSAQKTAARIARILHGAGLHEDERQGLAAAQSDYPWPVIKQRTQPFEDLGGDLPDHLVERAVIVRGKPFNGVVEARLQGKVRAVANVLESGRVAGEFAVLGDVALYELAELRARGLDVVVLHKRRLSRDGTIVDWEHILLNAILRDRRPSPAHVGVVAFDSYDTPRGAVVQERCSIALRSELIGLARVTLWIVEQERSDGLRAHLARSQPQELVVSLSGDVTEGIR